MISNVAKAFTEHQATIRRIIAKYRSNPEDIEDLLQETFLKSFAAEARQHIREPKAFLFRVAKHVAINEAKRKVHTHTDSIEDSSQLAVLTDKSPSVEEEVEHRRRLLLFTQAMATLTPELREALVLRKLDNLKFKEIAERLDVSVSTVEKRVATALVRCKAYLRKKGFDIKGVDTMLAASIQSKSPPSAFSDSGLATAQTLREGHHNES